MAESLIVELQARIAALEEQRGSTSSNTDPALRNRAPMKLPTPEPFHGSKDRIFARDWIDTLDNYFAAASVTDDAERIRFATVLLREHAQRWWRQAKDSTDPTWTAFTKALITYFSPVGSDQVARTNLERVKQRGAVHAYADEFRRIADQIPTMTDTEKKEKFCNGLKQPVRLQVAFANPETLEESIMIATRIDDIIYNYSRVNANPTTGYSQRSTTTRTTKEINTARTYKDATLGRNNTTASTNANKLQKLTPAERERLKKAGACFRCRKPGHTALQCPLRQSQGNTNRRQ